MNIWGIFMFCFTITSCGVLDIHRQKKKKLKKMNLHLSLSCIQKLLKWTMHLNVKYKTVIIGRVGDLEKFRT